MSVYRLALVLVAALLVQMHAATYASSQELSLDRSRHTVQTGKCENGGMWFWSVDFSESGEPIRITGRSCDGTSLKKGYADSAARPFTPHSRHFVMFDDGHTLYVKALTRTLVIQCFDASTGTAFGNEIIVESNTVYGTRLKSGRYIVLIRDPKQEIEPEVVLYAIR